MSRPESTGRARLGGIARSARPWQWSKNGVCLAGLVFSGRLLSFPDVARAGLAFLGFCLISSCVYLVNDLLDRDRDRANPRKRSRPIASGLVSPAEALLAALALAVGAFGLTMLLPSTCAWLLAFYLGLNLAYSAGLKNAVLLDVLIIAVGFVVRVLHGVVAVGVEPSAWIILCTFFLALFLGYAKRRAELEEGAPADSSEVRPVLRKYQVFYLDMVLGMTATLSILCYALYTVVGRPDRPLLVLTIPLVFYGVIHYLYLVMIHHVGGEPDRQLLHNRVTVAVVVAWAGLCTVALYTDLSLPGLLPPVVSRPSPDSAPLLNAHSGGNVRR